jgi:hypothetical protein
LPHDGIVQPVIEGALDYGITPAIIVSRTEHGMSIAGAMSTRMKTGG